MQLGRDWLARIFLTQAHIAARTMIDMKRTYTLVYAIGKRLVCKDILDSGMYIVATKSIEIERTYLLVYAIRKRLVCTETLDSGTYSRNNHD
jgi:hypothetical protein